MADRRRNCDVPLHASLDIAPRAWRALIVIGGIGGWLLAGKTIFGG